VLGFSASKRRRPFKNDITEAQFDRMVQTTSRLAMLFIGLCVVVFALKAAHAILVPVALAITIGLMFGPVADRLEARGIPPAISAALVLIGFIVLIAVAVLSLAVPLSEWVGRAPTIWAKVQNELSNWQGPLEAIANMQDQLKSALGADAAVEVAVADNSQVIDLALVVPTIIGDILIFLVSLYFYLATREQIRVSILSLCVTRRLRWRTAHVFNDVESKVSRFLLSVTFLNVCVGVAMTLITWALGLPSPLLWGVLAAILNYIPYVGQAVMILILLAVGFATQPTLTQILLPVGAYMVVNMIEGQMIFPQFVGRTMTLNPFLIFLSIIFWIWVWGPVGSLMAVPALLILQSVLLNILPSRDVKPRRPVRRTANMTHKDVVLANAAKAIKEQAEEEAKAEALAAAERGEESPAEPEKVLIPDPEPVAVKKRTPRAPRKPAKPKGSPATA
jgi:predicted PurR-regulated permease PerM